MKKRKFAVALLSLVMLAGCDGQTSDIGSDTSAPNTEKATETAKPTEKPTENPTEKPTEKDTSAEAAREEALAYLNSIDTTLYREEEKKELDEMIATLKEAINSEDATEESIKSAIESFKTYLETLKTKADYEREEEEKKNQELKEARDAKLAEVKIAEVNRFRSEERATALALQKEQMDAVNALQTKEEIEAYSLEAYKNQITELKTNAEYTMDEMVEYHGYPSKWSLVNEHAFTWTREGDHVKTEAVGYLFDAANTYDDVTFTMTVDAPVDTTNVAVLLGKNSEVNDGFTGYLMNIHVESDKNYQYVQVYNVVNGFASYGDNQVCAYIDGWTYEQTGNKVLGTTFRFEKKGSTIGIYDEKEYQKNPDAATRINVDLLKNGYALENDLHFGIFNWDGRLANVRIDDIITDDENVIDSVETAKFYSELYLATVDLNKYRETEKAAILTKKNELIALYTAEGTSYKKIIDKMNEMKEFVKTQKTDADYQAEEDAKNLSKVKENKIASMFVYEAGAYSAETAPKVLAIYNEAKDAVNALTTIDAVNGFDFTPYQTRIDALGDNVTEFLKELKDDPTKSSWDLVVEHANQWQYSGKTLTINSVAWQAGKTDYADFDLVVNMNSVNSISNSNGDYASVLVRANQSNESVNGYAINFCNKEGEQYVQIWYLHPSFGYSFNMDYLGGWVYPGKINDATFRISFIGTNCYIYDEAEYAKSGTDAFNITVDLSVGGREVYQSGKIGAACWASSPDAVKAANLNFKKIVRR